MKIPYLRNTDKCHPPDSSKSTMKLSPLKGGLRGVKQILQLTGSIILLAGMVACGGNNTEKGSSSENAADSTNSFRADTVQVDVAKVESRDFVQTLDATGTLNARQKATVRAKVAGEIEKIYVDIGDKVQNGQILLKINSTDYQLALDQAQAKLAQAKATLDNSKREKERMAGLYKAGSATEQNRDQAATAYDQAKAGYQQALAAQKDAQQKLDYTSIRAPFSGVVTKRFFKKGDYAKATDPAAQVVDLSVLEAEMDIPEKYAGSIKKGLSVNLQFQSQIDSTQGKVTAVNPQIDTDSRTFLVKVTVNNDNRSLSDGLFFNAEFQLPEIEDQPAVPAGAVQKDQGQNVLWVIKNGKAHRQVVQQGPKNDDWVMIQQGVTIGETVAVGGTGSLIDGYPVTAKNEE